MVREAEPIRDGLQVVHYRMLPGRSHLFEPELLETVRSILQDISE